MRAHVKAIAALAVTVMLFAALAAGQAGRKPGAPNDVGKERALYLNVVAARADGSDERITSKQLALYDGGMEQTIQSFTPDPGPARIGILLDNSFGLRAAVEKLQKATREFAYEIYEGDKVMVIGYDQNAEIVADWTDDAKKIEAALPEFRKRKRVILLVADGLDRGSKTRFEQVFKEILREDITVYALQIPDRTGGALRRDNLKPNQVTQKLTEGTGGRVLSVNDSREAAKEICDELRKNRYVLSYTPTSLPLYETRRLLIVPDDGISVRYKLTQPGN